MSSLNKDQIAERGARMATAILDSFAPLSKWLDELLAGRQVEWGS
jgi:hypothetical protein